MILFYNNYIYALNQYSNITCTPTPSPTLKRKPQTNIRNTGKKKNKKNKIKKTPKTKGIYLCYINII